MTTRPQIFGGYLIREDGALVKEITFTPEVTVPFGLVRNHTRRRGVRRAENMNLEKCLVSFAHGDRLHFAVFSSVELFKDVLEKIEQAVKEIERADFDKSHYERDNGRKVLVDFENKLKAIRRAG
ncbi:MAG: hypothetical protein KAW09_10795 [Thermoplasmata archaeon]|nr:hypothetical protein [Thermoplasmata archaeon]